VDAPPPPASPAAPVEVTVRIKGKTAGSRKRDGKRGNGELSSNSGDLSHAQKRAQDRGKRERKPDAVNLDDVVVRIPKIAARDKRAKSGVHESDGNRNGGGGDNVSAVGHSNAEGNAPPGNAWAKPLLASRANGPAAPAEGGAGTDQGAAQGVSDGADGYRLGEPGAGPSTFAASPSAGESLVTESGLGGLAHIWTDQPASDSLASMSTPSIWDSSQGGGERSSSLQVIASTLLAPA
jgi:hypothetical protein